MGRGGGLNFFGLLPGGLSARGIFWLGFGLLSTLALVLADFVLDFGRFSGAGFFSSILESGDCLEFSFASVSCFIPNQLDKIIKIFVCSIS